jgi:hypothetical protein
LILTVQWIRDVAAKDIVCFNLSGQTDATMAGWLGMRNIVLSIAVHHQTQDS